MSSPKHLWSGDWERESAARSEDLAGRPRRPATPVAPAPASASPPRPRRRRPALPQVSAAWVVVLGVLVMLAGGGYWLSRLIDTSSSAQTTAAAANQTG